MARISLHDAQDVAGAALIRNGAAGPVAQSVAGALVRADADGFKGHGLGRLPSYVAQLRAGKINASARIRPSRPRPGTLLVDADHGFAYPALDLATGALPDMARSQGIACAAIARSHHCGAAGLFAETLARQGLIALLFANTPAAMAPWGGNRAVFGTNPIAFACPRGAQDDPIVIDMALSRVARGNIAAAARRNQAIPPDWAFDSDGQPTTDAKRALEGTMAPLGDAKGIALALMVELLAAGMTGSNYAAEASSFLDAEGPPPGTGQFLVAIDATAFAPDATDRFAALARAIEGQEGARLPGARRFAMRAEAERQGIELGDDLMREIAAL
ncbi:Ldh family oxidoreductase [Paracoccus siganidrum]|uniref:Ldh family oxidoreductase n=1 Tax=Paracoccus siganidrum TaxID=1276757 RepID=A0A419AC36_9RHOB|nr:Ldh family oxidoreductase [Paracoccus siganidrum]RJL21557.1 Ldh family oxidoreductase [Paracoccus siganidrum]RMC30904.1 Ldh family oxidoreductase [Paracoccus siganidrum]